MTKPRTLAPRPANAPITGDNFVGRFEVIAGDMRNRPRGEPIPKHWALIERVGDEYRLCYQEGETCETLQHLRFDDATCTLQSTDRKPPRCISLWLSEDAKRIFALRLKPEEDASETRLLPWESNDDNGTWGAEEEPPPA